MDQGLHAERFRAFLTAARLKLRPVSSAIPRFHDFVSRSRPLATKHARQYLRRLSSVAAELRPWLVGVDLLHIAGVSYAEVPYTALIAWTLDATCNPTTAGEIQSSWLSILGLSSLAAHAREEPFRVHSQLCTDDGVPDIVLNSRHALIVIEAKTASKEHLTPAARVPQTTGYLAAARKVLKIQADCPGQVVFLTPARIQAANLDARATSYADFALALARGAASSPIPEDLRWSLAALITHFLTRAIPRDVELHRVLLDAEKLQSLSDSELISELHTLQAVSDVLPIEEVEND